MVLMQDTDLKIEENTTNEVVKDSDKRVYEVGYLLIPTLGEEDLPVVFGNLKNLISSFGGEIISDEMPKMIPLSYNMTKVIQNIRNKYNNAYFGWTKFELDGEQMPEFKKKLNLETNFLRFLILKTIRANTMSSRRFVPKDLKKRTYTKKKEDSTEPINKEEIDKEIEAMVSI